MEPINISEADMRGVFGHKCDQANCRVCNPDMTLTEWAELYERAASPGRACQWCHNNPCSCPKPETTLRTLEQVIRASRDAALTEAAKATHCYRCEVAIEALKVKA